MDSPPPPPQPDRILIPPSTYPLHPWRRGRRQPTYYAISPAVDELPPQRWPINFTVRYIKSPNPSLTLVVVLGLILIFLSSSGSVTQPELGTFQAMTRYGLNTTSVLLRQEYYRLVTGALVHLDIIHLASNIIGLLVMGVRLEPQFGRLRWGVLLGFSALFSSLIWVMTVQNSFRTLIGASGMVYAMIGASLAHIAVNRRILGREISRHLRNWFIIITVLVGLDVFANLTNRGGAQIDIWIHMLGFVTGLAIGWLIAPRMNFTLLGLSGITVDVAVDDDNPFRWRYVQIFGLLALIGVVILLLIGRQRWPSILG